jgi:hypothetical protein
MVALVYDLIAFLAQTNGAISSMVNQLEKGVVENALQRQFPYLRKDDDPKGQNEDILLQYVPRQKEDIESEPR